MTPSRTPQIPAVLSEPAINKGTAFTVDERRAL